MNIKHIHLTNIITYDGSQIEPSWGFRKIGVYGSSIITWIGPVDIKPDNLKDFEDVGLEIKSDEMANFICEFYDCQPANMRIAYLRQRLLVMIFREMLMEHGVETVREGDDIYVDDRKLSISIATANLSCMKIHFAFNLRDEGTPDDIDTIGLFDLKNSNGEQAFDEGFLVEFMHDITERYMIELDDIEDDISKTNLLK